MSSHAGFVRWIKTRDEFNDLTEDLSSGVRSLRGMVLEMEREGACYDARAMLLFAIREYEPEGVPRDSWEALTGWAHFVP